MPDGPTEQEVEQFLLDWAAMAEAKERLGFEDRWLAEREYVAKAKATMPSHAAIKRTMHVPLRRTPRRYIGLNVVGIGPPTSETPSHWKATLMKLKPDASGVGWDFDNPVSSFELEDEELDRLARVLMAHGNIAEAGEFVLVPSGAASETAKLVAGLLDETNLKAKDLGNVLTSLLAHPELVGAVASIEDDRRVISLAAAANLAHREKATAKLHELIAQEADESAFQALFEANWWMFGARFVGRIDRRDFTTDEQLDLVLIRADGFPEVIELKKSNIQVFKKIRDGIPPKYGMGASVNDAVNQAAHYISELEAQRDSLNRKYKQDFFRPQARIVIGLLSSDEEDYEAKRLCLRQFNDHLHGIQVLTYADIASIAARLVEVDRDVAAGSATSGSHFSSRVEEI